MEHSHKVFVSGLGATRLKVFKRGSTVYSIDFWVYACVECLLTGNSYGCKPVFLCLNTFIACLYTCTPGERGWGEDVYAQYQHQVWLICSVQFWPWDELEGEGIVDTSIMYEWCGVYIPTLNLVHKSRERKFPQPWLALTLNLMLYECDLNPDMSQNIHIHTCCNHMLYREEIV